MEERISWDELAMGIVHIYSKRSACKHFKVGAVFFNGNRIIAAGYNGPPSGEPHCIKVGCAKEKDGILLPAGSGLCVGAHAEMNAIVNAAKEGINLSNTKLYCTYAPCYSCAKHLVGLISEFIYEKEYSTEDQRTFELFMRKGVAIRKFNS